MESKKLSNIVFPVLGSISVLSVFIVVPYMVGYFSYFNRNLLNVFSLAEYYYFSAVPILTVSALFILYSSYPFLAEQINLLPFRMAERVRRFFVARKSKRTDMVFGEISLRFVLTTTHAIILLGFPLAIAFSIFIFPVRFIIVLLPLTFGVIVISLNRLLRLPPYLLYFLFFLSFEILLVAWGYHEADQQYQDNTQVSVVGEKVNAQGGLIFLGSGHVAIFDKDHDVIDVNVDKSATVTLGKFEPASGRCLEYELLEKIRAIFELLACHAVKAKPSS